MKRLWRCPERFCWSLVLALAILFLATGKAQAQYMGYGWGSGYPGLGYGYPGWGYGYPGWGYGYPGWGVGAIRPYPYYYPGYTLPVLGSGYPGFGYGYAYPGTGLGMGYLRLYGSGFYNPMFGVGLTPLGVQSYMVETRLLGRVPRVSTRSGGSRSLP